MDREFEILNMCLDKASEMEKAVKELEAEEGSSVAKLKNDIDLLLTTISVCLAEEEDKE